MYTGSIYSNYYSKILANFEFCCFLLSFHRTENRQPILSTARLHCVHVSSQHLGRRESILIFRLIIFRRLRVLQKLFKDVSKYSGYIKGIYSIYLKMYKAQHVLKTLSFISQGLHCVRLARSSILLAARRRHD